VIGSRGSIIEFLLTKPQKVSITDEKMTRFWINFQQAFDLVLFGLNNMQGGETFIPKISSMKLVDIFDALVPEAEKEIIGIRPGEKLHEILLTKNESRHAIELEKYFVILPEQGEVFNTQKDFERHIKSGKKIDPNFSYTSDNNQEWIEQEEFKKIVREMFPDNKNIIK
ncbi:polysaccharide biosynthesis protein, partial [bacterium]|nr:polysaccharide biosynthesis protein [bacterium]